MAQTIFQISLLVLLSWHAARIGAFPPGPPPDFLEEPTTTEASTIGLPPIFTEDEDTEKPTDSFHLSMLKNLTLTAHNSIRMSGFKIPSENLLPGHYLGKVDNLDPVNGNFRPGNGGVYLISAHLQLKTADEAKRRRRQEPEELQQVTVAVCIDDCLEVGLSTTATLMGAESTVSLVGHLQLQSKQQVSVKITNNSSSTVTILKRSSFSVHRLQ